MVASLVLPHMTICETASSVVSPKRSTIPKRETELKSALMEEISTLLPRPRYMAFRHEDVRQKGIPDISVTAGKCTSWWEAKHATPDFYTFGLQELTCKRLAQAGYCRYIIWYETEVACKTLIVHPQNLIDLTPEAEADGHDHHFVAAFMRMVHMTPSLRLR